MMRSSSGKSSHCVVVPYWNNNNQRHQIQEQVEGNHGEERNNHITSSHVQNHHHHNNSSSSSTTTSTTNIVPVSNNYHHNHHQHQIKELTWENGQIAMHGFLPSGPSKPIWARTGGTLESVVHQATCHTQGPNNNMTRTPATMSANIVGSAVGKWAEKPTPTAEMRKRARAESDPKNLIGKQEEQCGAPSGCASASATFCRDSETTMVTWASFESPPSLKNKTTEQDSTSQDCLENQDEDRDTKGKSGRSNCTRRSRVAAFHNQSERRRRDRINQKMKALQKLVPNASKTDKASMLDEVIEYLKQLQAQVQVMSSVRNMAAAAASVAPPPQMMMSLGMLQQQQQQQQQQHHMHMALLAAAAARMGMGMFDMSSIAGAAPPHSLIHPNPLSAGPTFVPPPFMMPHVVPAQSQAKSAGSSSSSSAPPSLPLPDPYCALLAQNMEFYNKMAALYNQQVSHATQAVSNPSRSSQVQAD